MLWKHLKQSVRICLDISFFDLREEAVMWLENEQFKDSHDKLKIKSGSTVSEEPLSDVCSGLTRPENDEKKKLKLTN